LEGGNPGTGQQFIQEHAPITYTGIAQKGISLIQEGLLSHPIITVDKTCDLIFRPNRIAILNHPSIKS
jgi:hypothetical protein